MDIENCPKCGAKFIKGNYDIDTEFSWGSFLLFGLSAPHYLWFKSNDENSKKELCMKCSDPNKGYKCSGCGLMIIDTPLQPPTLVPEFPSIVLKGV